MQDELIVKFDTAAGDLPQKSTRKLVRRKLADFGFKGTWRLQPLRKFRRNYSPFVAVTITHSRTTNEPSIKIRTMPEDRESSWESLLIPPAEYDIEDVFGALKGIQETEEPTTATEDEQQPTSELDFAAKHRLAQGAVYYGTVKHVQADVATIELCQGVEGLISADEWDHTPINDLTQKIAVGDRVKALLVSIDGDTITLDRKSVVDYPEDQVLNASEEIETFKPTQTEKLALRGFAKEHSNLLWLLGLLTEHYDVIYDPDKECIPKSEINDLWTMAVCERYNAKQLASPIAPLFRSLCIKEWLVPVEGRDERGKEVRIGYNITDLGWRESKQDKPSIAPKPPTTSIHPPPKEVPEGLPDIPKGLPDTRDEHPIPSDTLPGGINLGLLQEFKRKIHARDSITKQIEELQKELTEIDKWISDHPDAMQQHRLAKDQYSKLRELMGED